MPDLPGVRHPVAVRVREERARPGLDLGPVGESVAVRVGVERIRPRRNLRAVFESVAVRVRPRRVGAGPKAEAEREPALHVHPAVAGPDQLLADGPARAAGAAAIEHADHDPGGIRCRGDGPVTEADWEVRTLLEDNLADERRIPVRPAGEPHGLVLHDGQVVRIAPAHADGRTDSPHGVRTKL